MAIAGKCDVCKKYYELVEKDENITTAVFSIKHYNPKEANMICFMETITAKDICPECEKKIDLFIRRLEDNVVEKRCYCSDCSFESMSDNEEPCRTCISARLFFQKKEDAE